MKRAMIAFLCLGMVALPAAWAQLGNCSRKCKESSVLSNPAGQCRVFEDTVTGLQTWNAWNAPPRTFAQVLKNHPAPLTGRTVQAWSPPCWATCSNADGTLPHPQEGTTQANWKLNKKNVLNQRECTQPGA